jgi:hypothetical protein
MNTRNILYLVAGGACAALSLLPLQDEAKTLCLVLAFSIEGYGLWRIWCEPDKEVSVRSDKSAS